MKIEVLVVDDHSVVREGLKSVIENEADMTVVAEAGDGETALQKIRECNTDVVIMDVEMPGLSGIETTKRMSRECAAKVLALSAYSSIRYVQGMLKAGAVGYILKECVLDELPRAIRRAVEGGIYLSAKLTQAVVSDYIKRLCAAEEGPLALLTKKEIEVLQLIAKGMPPREMAYRLYVTVSTVAKHRQNAMEKLGLTSNADLIKFAIREGIATLDE